MDNSFHCWMGLNTALYNDRFEIIPFVGLHVVAIEKIFALKIGKYPFKYNRGIATYPINLGALETISEDERAFALNPEQSQEFINSECVRLVDLYYKDGRNYAESIANYKTLLPLLQKNVETLGGYPEDTPHACI